MTKSKSENLLVDEKYNGERLDKFLADVFTDISRSSIARLADEGQITINGKQAGKKEKVKTGQAVEIIVPVSKEIDLEPENIPIDIVYEDDDLLVVNKPKGMVVHPAAGHWNGTLVNALMYHCKDSLSGINGEIRPGILHRIDKDTSGLLIVAKNDFSHIHLSEQIKAHSFKREYEAIAEGCFNCKSGTVNAPIGRNPNNRLKMCVIERNSKKAVTHYEVIEEFDKYTHLRLKLETGRTHQIRVHLSYSGHPVAGDKLYGAKTVKEFEGQCLHAKVIGFIHPRTDEYMEFESKLPEYFTNFLYKIR